MRTLLFGIISAFMLNVDAACVREWKANLRKGPGSNFQKSWEVGKYMPLKELGRKGAWIKVQDVDKAVHWVHGTLLTRSVACVVVRKPYTYLRTGPGTKFPKAFAGLADKYTPFKKVTEKKGWVQVENARKERFWVFGKNVWEALTYQAIHF